MMKKGEAGYAAFMECLEYLYPDLYKELTGKEANPPPKGMRHFVIDTAIVVLKTL